MFIVFSYLNLRCCSGLSVDGRLFLGYSISNKGASPTKGSDTMKYAPMTRFERRGEDPREANSLKREIMKEIEPLDTRELQIVLHYIRRKKG